MPEQTPSTLAAFAADATQAFLLPGEILLGGIAAAAPRAAEVLAFGTGGIVVKFVLALISWTILVVIGLLLSRACRRIARQFGALFHILLWHVRTQSGNLRMKLIWKYREFFPYKSASSEHLAQTDFDATDIKVLLSIARQGPGMAASAPDISASLGLRPAQVQSRLEQLRHFRMICAVMGSTDGFENYALTASGEAYLAMMRRQAKKPPGISRASAAKSY